ncbi:sensor histidine kinase [Arcticibacter eurypsychrophilus]|uniref:sensor histidine kinase n=1 Tax=Arcticibacter eurypsychrophilus TaxID=1434752 RepID=UPI00084D24DF|nr:PAS domain-containing sensor histidine kinase [Arcticibacter eurypsychrophilus]
MVKQHFVKYSISFLLVLAAHYLIKTLLSDAYGSSSYLFLTGLVVFTTRYLGKGPATFTTGLAIIVILWSLLTSTPNISLNEWIILLLFIAECGLIIYMIPVYLKTDKEELLKGLRFNKLVEKSANAFILVNLKGEIKYSNLAVHRITGYTIDQTPGLVIWNLIKEEDHGIVKEQFYKIASHEEKSATLLHRIVKNNGELIWVENTMTNLLNDPSVQSIVLNLSDVSARVSHEQEMEDFLAIASHELKTPLTSLKAYTQILEMRMNAENNTDSVLLVSKMDRQINRIISMIFDLLDVTKLQSGILYLKKDIFDINELILEVAETLGNVNRNHQIMLSLDKTTRIYADRIRINQVLVNLISNGIKYSPDADKIHISTRFEANKLLISVTDFGIGISPKEIQNLFNRFYRVSSVRESYQGLGLGLYISYQIIEHHKGKMGVFSEEGKGSTFWFTLPLEKEIYEMPVT